MTCSHWWSAAVAVAVFLLAYEEAAARQESTNAPASAPEYRPPTLLERRPVFYSERSRSNHVTGSVKLEFVVNPRGRVEAVQVVGGSGHGLLDLAAAYCVSGWKYAPAQRYGNPVEAAGTAEINFPPATNAHPTTPISDVAGAAGAYSTLPRYPQSSIRRGHEGTVELLLVVWPDGEIGDVAIVTSSGHLELDMSAATTAFERWQIRGTGGTNIYRRSVEFRLR